jgi:hypothetical protein
MPAPPLAATPFSYTTGLDIGQAQDFTALVVVEWNDRLDPEGPPSADGGPCYARHYGVRHLVRWRLGTSYPAIVAEVKEMSCSPPLRDTTLVVDATGVGAAVVDMLRVSDLPATLKQFTSTAGFKPGEEGDAVPKKDLVGAVLAPLQTRRLTIAKGLELAETLGKELEEFRVKVTPDRNETFASWRERSHDDLVLATALAVWVASQEPVYTDDPYGLKLRPPEPDPTAHIWRERDIDAFAGSGRR